MQLPAHPEGGVQVGISDILAWRACPTRMEFGMRRHDEGGEAPESWSPANAYGSACHMAIELVDGGSSDQDAVQAAFSAFSAWLDPTDIGMLHDDLATYHTRNPRGVRTLVAEEDWSFPLFTHRTAGPVWFRFKLDRLYQRVAEPHRLIAVDYKTSKWIKTKEEVDKDLQMWSYNVGIHEVVAELYPELENVELLQLYEQLRAGQVPTRKSAGQRAEMKRWLILAVTAMIDDTTMAPSYNEFCPWCPLKMDCPVVRDELTDYALARIAALAPRHPKKLKSGGDSKVLGPPELDPARFAEYVAELPKVKRSQQVLEKFEETVREAMKEMPAADLAALGYKTERRKRSGFTTEGLRIAHEMMGPDAFFSCASLSASSVEKFYGGDERDLVAEILAQRTEAGGYDVVTPVR